MVPARLGLGADSSQKPKRLNYLCTVLLYPPESTKCRRYYISLQVLTSSRFLSMMSPPLSLSYLLLNTSLLSFSWPPKESGSKICAIKACRALRSRVLGIILALRCLSLLKCEVLAVWRVWGSETRSAVFETRAPCSTTILERGGGEEYSVRDGLGVVDRIKVEPQRQDSGVCGLCGATPDYGMFLALMDNAILARG